MVKSLLSTVFGLGVALSVGVLIARVDLSAAGSQSVPVSIALVVLAAFLLGSASRRRS